MRALSSLGRFIFAIPFIVFGVFHFMDTAGLSVMIGTWPTPQAWIYFSGLALILAGVSIIINVKARLATLLLALLLLVIILAIHIPATLGGDQKSVSVLLKDISLLGAALTYSGLLKK